MRLRHIAAVLTAQAALAVAAVNCSEPEPPRLGGPNSLEGKEHPRPSSAEEGNKGEGICGEAGGAINGGPCAVSFAKDIMPLLTGTAWGCAGASCHVSIPPVITTNAQDTWDALRRKTTAGKPYINPCSVDPAASSFECNLLATGACGSKMPPPSAPAATQPTEAEIKKVRDWIVCGSPFN
jgi:hypothetical protein